MSRVETQEIVKFKKVNLLKEFEPVLYFAPSERFFPTNVEDYINNCELWSGKRKKTHKWEIDELKDKDPQHFFYFGHEYKWPLIIERIIVLTALSILLFVIWYSSQPEQFSLLRRLNPHWPQFWRGLYDDVRMLILSAFILYAAYKQVNPTVTIAFAQCLAAILFFGTPAGTAFSMVTGFFVLGYSLFVLWFYSLRKWSWLRKQPVITVVIVLLLFYLIVITASIFVEQADQLLGIGISLTQSEPLETIYFSWIKNYPDLLVFLLRLPMGIAAVGLIVSWFLNKVIEFSNDRLMSNPKYRHHVLSTVLLVIGTLLVVSAFYWIRSTNLVRDDQIISYALIAVFATMIIFSYFANPFTFYERVLETKNEINDNQPQYLRMLSIMTIFFIIYFVFSLIIALPNPMLFRLPEDFIILYTILYILIIPGYIFVTVGLLGSSVAGYFLDLRSSQPDLAAIQAKFKYDIIQNSQTPDMRFHYYGRVTTEGRWIVLQYHYFYAFNDWRSVQGGLNQHEGDWECINIYLKEKLTTPKNYAPDSYEKIGVACSQHHNGEFCFWEDKKLEKFNKTHPCIYVAKGSHANFFEPDNHKSSMLVSGIARQILNQIDRIVRMFRGQTYGLPTELTSSDGCIIGINIFHWESNLIEDDELWVEYQGLWGKQEKHPDESGPTGPKWDRNKVQEEKGKHDYQDRCRIRWGQGRGGLEWLETLLLEQALNRDLSIKERKRALKAFVQI